MLLIVLGHILDVFQDITGLTIQRLADSVQSGESDGTDLTRFDVGQIDIRYTDLLGQFVQGHLSVSHDPVQS